MPESAPIDWLRMLHRGVTLLRAARGDDVDTDHLAERARAVKLKETIDSTARAVIGCQRTADCDCPICREHREENHP